MERFLLSKNEHMTSFLVTVREKYRECSCHVWHLGLAQLLLDE